MIADALKTFRQLGDPKLLRVLLWSLLASTALFAGLVVAAGWFLTTVSLDGLGWFGDILEIGGVVLGTLLAVYVALLLFPAISATVQSLFLDGVAEAVESKWYRGLPPARSQSIGELLSTGLQLMLVMLVVNMILLPAYIVLLFFPPFNLVLFYLVNGWLIGREYLEIVAFRRMEPARAKAFRRRFRGRIWLEGVLVMLLFSIPVLNLAAPVIGTAFMVHRFHRRWGHGVSPPPTVHHA